MRRAALLLVSALLGCAETEPDPAPAPAPTFEYPLDDTLRFHHLQAKSTHNSYHVETEGNSIAALAFTHAPLDEQLAAQGVRHVELDLRFSASLGVFEVYHLPAIDQETTCRAFADCLRALAVWSDAHPAHHPITAQLELKDPIPGDLEEYFAAIHAEIEAIWPRDRLITPALVQADHPTLADAVRSDGWPTLGRLRGKLLLTLDDSGEWRDAYTRGRTSLDDRLIFADSDPSDPFAAIAVRNDPADAAAIAEALSANMLVRTRADSDNAEPLAGDTARRDAAFASGAHFVSTDYPAKTPELDYWVDVPGGSPSRCNPITAPAECTSPAIEDPDQL